MPKHSILKTAKPPTPTAYLKSDKIIKVNRRRPKIYPNFGKSKLDAPTLDKLRIYQKQGLLSKSSTIISSIYLQKTGLFNGFSDLLDFLFTKKDPNQVNYHSFLFKRLAQKLKATQSSSLQIDIIHADDFTLQFLKIFKHSLSSLKYLKTLNVVWRLSEATNNQCIPFFMQILLKLRQITSLNIDFQCSELTYPQLEYFTYTLSKLSKLKSLSMNFSSVLPIFETPHSENLLLACFAASLRRLKSLEELGLNFSRNLLVSDAALRGMGSSFSCMINLRKLSISLSNTPVASDVGLSFILAPLKNLACLKHVYLDFNNCVKGTKSLKSFSAALGDLQQLRSLSIFCDNWNPDDYHATEGLSNAIGRLNNLSELVLTLYGWTNAGGRALKTLSRALNGPK